MRCIDWIACAHMSGLLTQVCDLLAQMGCARKRDSQHESGVSAPVNRAECSLHPLNSRRTTSSFPRKILALPRPVWSVRRYRRQAFAAGRYGSPVTIIFQAMRAILFAKATATSLTGLRAIKVSSHGHSVLAVRFR